MPTKNGLLIQTGNINSANLHQYSILLFNIFQKSNLLKSTNNI